MAQYKAVDSLSSIKFKIKNLGINVAVTFSGLQGYLSFDKKDLEKAVFKFSIHANTVNTGNDMRDSHLKKESYFNTENYLRISFESTRIINSKKEGMFIVYGKLTIKNHSNEIFFPFTAEPSADGYLFKAVLSVNRKNFDAGGSSIVSDNAEISLNVFAHK